MDFLKSIKQLFTRSPTAVSQPEAIPSSGVTPPETPAPVAVTQSAAPPAGPPAQREKLMEIAQGPGEAFRNAPYYDIAEPDMDNQWQTLLWPFLKDRGIDFHCVLDLAAGHGRNSAKLIQHADHIIIVDITQENIDFCKQRFTADDRFTFLKNDGLSLAGIDDESVTFVYTFDSMVHFDSDVVREYLKEFFRVLKPGGFAFCHHSNYTGSPGNTFSQNPAWRNFMSKELFAHYCIKEGLVMVEQQVIDWSEPDLDCFSLFRKP